MGVGTRTIDSSVDGLALSCSITSSPHLGEQRVNALVTDARQVRHLQLLHCLGHNEGVCQR